MPNRLLKTVIVLTVTGSSVIWPMLMSEKADARFGQTLVQSNEAVITNVAALSPFFRQLSAIEKHTRQRPLRIIQYGDSHTKADLFTGAVRKNLLRDFGGEMPSLVKKTAYSPRSGGYGITVYQPQGVNGARAKRLRDMSENPRFLESLAQDRPDLIVLAYGTNEVTDQDWTVTSYSQMLIGTINRLRTAAPDASFLIVGPPDRSVPSAEGWSSVRRMSALLEAQRRAALSTNAAFWSGYDAMGGAGSMNQWVSGGLARYDHVHFTAAGYTKLAGLFYRDLMNSYRAGSRFQPAPVQGIDMRVMQRNFPISKKSSN